MINALWMLVILPGIAGLIALTIRKKIESVFALAIFAVIVVLYGFALAGMPVAGYHTIRVMGAGAFGICAVIGLLKREKRRYLFTPGAAAFVLIVIASWWAHRGQVYVYQDEFSHWGRACSALYRLQKLPHTVPGTLNFPSYPPGSTLFYTFWSWLGGAFSEGSTIAASNVFLVSCMLPLMQWTDWKHWKRIVPMFLICVMIPLVYYVQAYQDVYVDVLLGCIASYALIAWFTSKRDWQTMLMIDGALFILPLIKASGIAIALLVLGVMALDLLSMNRKGLKTLIVPTVCLAASALSWNVFCRLHQLAGDKPFRYDEIIQNIKNVLDGTVPWEQEYLFQNFFHFLSLPMMMGGGHILQLSYIEWMLAFAAAACWLKRGMGSDSELKASADRAGRAAWTLIASTAVYALTLFHLYLYTFEPWEASGLHSFDRYMSTIMTAAAAVIVALALHMWQLRPPKILPATLTILICLALVVDPGHLISLTFTAPRQTEQTRATRADMCPPAHVMQYLKPDDSVAWLACEAENGNEWLPYILNSYEFSPVRVGTPFGLVLNDQLSSETVLQSLLRGNWKYVYCYNVSQDFIASHAALFADPENIADGTLYELVKDGEEAKLHGLY